MNWKSKVDFQMIKNKDFIISLYIIYYIYIYIYISHLPPLYTEIHENLKNRQ